jgi:hypothetical protein
MDLPVVPVEAEPYGHRHLQLDSTAWMHPKADRLSLAWRNLIAEMPEPTQAPAG